MLGQLSHKGGARLDGNGRFEVFLNSGDNSKSPLISETWKQYIRELFDFLMSQDNERQIGVKTVYKRRSAAGNSMVDVEITDGMVFRLVRGQGEFATFILELPFMGKVEFVDDTVGATSSDEHDEWKDLDA